MKTERNQFTFYLSFFKTIQRIKSKSSRAAAYDAICAYALYGAKPDLENMPAAVAMAVESALPNLDASRRKAEGGMGGTPMKDKSRLIERYGKDPGNKKETEEEVEVETEGEKENKNKCFVYAPGGARREKRKKVPMGSEERILGELELAALERMQEEAKKRA